MGLSETLVALDRHLARYAPTLRSRARGSRDVSPFESLGGVPAELSTLWAWADGMPELIVPDSDELAAAMDLLSISQAANVTAELREVADLDRELVPFATDGCGNYLVLDARDRVLDWDHETRNTRWVAASLAALLERSCRALEADELFGGPEKRPGEIDPKLVRAEGLLAKAWENLGRIEDLAERLEPADSYRVLCKLRAAIADRATGATKRSLCSSIARAAARAGKWDDALESLAVGGCRDETWVTIGFDALDAGAFAHAARALGRGNGLEARVGRAVATWRETGEARAEIDAVAGKIGDEIAAMDAVNAGDRAAGRALNATVQRYLGPLLVLDAALAKARGDELGAHTALARARTIWPEVPLEEVARAAGLVD